MSSDISITLEKTEISSGEEIRGTIRLNYHGRFDSVVVNSLIENSGDSVSFEMINTRRINHPYPRLSLLKSDIGNTNIIEFMARTNHLPRDAPSNVKFRAALIQEHKEIASSIIYLKIRK